LRQEQDAEASLGEIAQRAETARVELLSDPLIAPFIDALLPIPKPLLGCGEIKLIIIGQDPAVQDPRTRAHIRTVLTLDRNGQGRRYLESHCGDLGLALSWNAYAANACKCFFTAPPAGPVRC